MSSARQASELFSWRGAVMSPESGLDKTQRLVAMTLSLFMNADGGSCYPSVATLAAHSACSSSTVREALNVLVEQGWVVIDSDRKGGKQKTNNYRARIPSRVLAEELTRREPVSSPNSPTDGNSPIGDPKLTGKPHLNSPGAGEDEVNDHAIDEARDRDLLAAVPLATAYDPLKGTKVDGKNHPWDALVEVTGADVLAEAGQVAAALKRIRRTAVAHAVEAGADLSDGPDVERQLATAIHERARLYRARWPDVELTPTALAKHWTRVTTAAAKSGRTMEDVRRVAQEALDRMRSPA